MPPGDGWLLSLVATIPSVQNVVDKYIALIVEPTAVIMRDRCQNFN